MNQDLEKIEEDLKKKNKRRQKHKQSGRSVFRLQEIIKEKSPPKKQETDQDEK